MTFAVLYEKSSDGYSAYAPDLPGCIATGETLDQTQERMYNAIHFLMTAMREDGDLIPEPSHIADMLEVA